MTSENTCKVLEFKHTNYTLKKQIRREAEKELIRLFKITAGFQDPFPPTEEQIRQFLDGFIEI